MGDLGIGLGFQYALRVNLQESGNLPQFEIPLREKARGPGYRLFLQDLLPGIWKGPERVDGTTPIICFVHAAGGLWRLNLNIGAS